MNALALWAIVAFLLIVITGLLGYLVQYKPPATQGDCLGILVDDRMRFSLTHLQVVLWALVFVSLLATIFLARWFGGVAPSELLRIDVPAEILTLAGISGGSAVVATAVKTPRTEKVRQLKPQASFSQVFMVEEGANMDKVIDVTRFQSFFLTLIAVGAYVIMAGSMLAQTTVPTGFPGFSRDLLWLIGLSHAAYIGGKFPEKT